MNKYFLSFLILSAMALTFCKQESKQTGINPPPANFQPGETANPKVLAGHWIAMDFCAFAAQYGSVLQTQNNRHVPYAYAITFNPAKPDSATCYNAFESWTLPIHYKNDTIELVGARPGKSIFLIYHSQEEKDILMIDPTGPRLQTDRFIKSKAGTADGYMAFTTALNHNVLSGEFVPIGKSADAKVLFTPGGFIQGMKAFDRYKICDGGDCFMAGQDIDVISFHNSKTPQKEPVYYGYRYNGQNDTLSLYNLVNGRPDEKGGAKVGSLAFKFFRKKVN